MEGTELELGWKSAHSKLMAYSRVATVLNSERERGVACARDGSVHTRVTSNLLRLSDPRTSTSTDATCTITLRRCHLRGKMKVF